MNNPLAELQARAYLKGTIDILASFDEAASIMVAAGVDPKIQEFLIMFASQMRRMQADIINKFEEMGVNVDGALDW